PHETAGMFRSISHNEAPRDKRRRPFFVVLGAISIYDLVYLAAWLWHGSHPIFGDFFALWSFGRFALLHPAPQIYDPIALQLFQHQLAPTLKGGYPFPYPPAFLLILAPLAHLPLTAAYLIWIPGTLALYLAVFVGPIRRLPIWKLTTWFLVAAPTTL